MPFNKGVAGLAGAAVFGVFAVAWVPAARADADSFYTATARSIVVTGFFSNPTIPGGVRPEGGGPQTDVSQSSLDKGDANASFPYFGEYAATAPGVVSGLFGVPVPPYPLTASSTFGGDPAKANYPGIELSAVSRATSTVADAVFGSQGAGGVSHSEVDESADGNVVAHASASSPLTVLGPLVSLKGFDAGVTVVADPNGKLIRTSNFVIDEIRVPGLVFKIPERTPAMYPVPFPVPVPGVPAPDPIPAPPIDVPAPFAGETIVEPKIGFFNGEFTIELPFAGERQKYALPAEPVLKAFSAQGVTVKYTAPSETKDGILGGVFSVEYTIPEPPENPFYNGPTPTTFVVGLTQAAVTRAPAAAAPSSEVVAPPPTAVVPPLTAEVPAVAPDLPLPDLVAPPAVPAEAVPATVNLTQAQPRDTILPAFVSAALPAFVDSDFSIVYLGLVGVALLAMCAAAVLVAKGVSTPWN
ncbi:MAG: hypothetical protein ACT4QG_07200 [Sporichthyaceae bacterium]